MPYGTCNGDYTCDVCKKPLREGEIAWVELKKVGGKLYCLDCRPKEAFEDPVYLRGEARKTFALQIAFKILKRSNVTFRMENIKLRNENQALKQKLGLFANSKLSLQLRRK